MSVITLTLVINYDEQSKALALTKYATDDRMEEVQRNYGSAVALRQMLENKMDIRAKIIRTNTNLLQELEKVSTLNQSILEQEIFTTEQSQQNSDKLQREKDALQKGFLMLVLLLSGRKGKGKRMQ